MGSVSSPLSSPGSGVASLLQTLSSLSPQLSSLFSQPNVQSALENAAPQDLVQLSDQALELQNVSVLFGGADGADTSGLSSPTDSLFSDLSPSQTAAQQDPLLQALESSLNAGANGSLVTYGATPAPNSSSQIGSLLSTLG